MILSLHPIVKTADPCFNLKIVNLALQKRRDHMITDNIYFEKSVMRARVSHCPEYRCLCTAGLQKKCVAMYLQYNMFCNRMNTFAL